ncbi:phosphonate transport system permease protein [Pseudorhizobium tarimense]|uniref:Phosphonate transport system permease protein n=1 Tax=Pseudorhizobium tarimense TaxID=1079109 RepID=A0ABV2H1W0_9HYPH|nr:phosphonate ABC transporter, permease protein PhnE [Pseudorhizobium tarimense]MCJ8517862.1 phosphonate ABC transporter, permease protein PhnE [Pseudorhizobium tarimense]
MILLNAAEMDALALSHPDLLHRSIWQRFRVPIIAVAVILYFIFAWWFFAVGKVVGSANWGLAGNYLADWVSYEIRPDIEIATDGSMQINYPRFDPIGPNPNPDWLEARRETVTRTIETPAPSAPATPTTPSSSFSFMAPAPSQQSETAPAAPTVETRIEEVVTEAVVQMGPERLIDVQPDRVVLTRGDEVVILTLDRAADQVLAQGPLPEWAEQRSVGGRVTAYFGFSGWADISADRVRLRKRFLGWENFFFDTNSVFFDKSAGEVLSLIVSGNRIVPGQSNLSLAWNDILYNPSWQHLDVWTKLLQTIVMAFIGTLFAMIVAFPLSFIAARNIFQNRPANQLTKRFFDFLRSVDMLIWALFFTRAFGPGPLAGISAIFFTDTGTLGKLYAEALENIDDKQREGVRSVGAPPATVQRYGVVPQVMPVFASQALYFWESNTRSATIIGAVGAGGIGLKLWEAMRTNSDWENVAYMVLLILIVVFLFDGISNYLRSKLIGPRNH